jgi:hypothetical protein
MKQIIAICGIAILAASCNTAAVRQQEEMLKAQAATIETMKVEMAKQRVIDSMNQVMAANTAPVQKETPVVVRTVRKKTAPKYSEPIAVSNTDTYTGYSNTNTAQPAPVQTPPIVQQEPAQEKKGWSAKAKGGVIGAGAGAVAGALIHKRSPALGAAVGGVLGGGAGIGIGAIIDKKQGRTSR